MDTASRMLGNYYIMPRVRADMTNQTELTRSRFGASEVSHTTVVDLNSFAWRRCL